MNFMFSRQEQYLTRSLRSLLRYCSCHSNIKFIYSRHRVISSIYVKLIVKIYKSLPGAYHVDCLCGLWMIYNCHSSGSRTRPEVVSTISLQYTHLSIGCYRIFQKVRFTCIKLTRIFRYASCFI